MKQQQPSLELNSTFKNRIKKHKKRLWSLAIALVLILTVVFFISYKVVDILLHHPRDTNVSYELNMDKTPMRSLNSRV